MVFKACAPNAPKATAVTANNIAIFINLSVVINHILVPVFYTRDEQVIARNIAKFLF